MCVQEDYDVCAHIHPATGFDMEKVKTTLKQFYRDWSRQVSNKLVETYSYIVDVQQGHF